MNLTFAKKGLMSFVTVFFLLGGLLLTAERAQAQGANWMAESDALVALDQSVHQYLNAQGTQTPGTPAWIDSDRHIKYYKIIMSYISNGLNVQTSVREGRLRLNDGASALSDMIPQPVLMQLEADATDLLTL